MYFSVLLKILKTRLVVIESVPREQLLFRRGARLFEALLGHPDPFAPSAVCSRVSSLPDAAGILRARMFAAGAGNVGAWTCRVALAITHSTTCNLTGAPTASRQWRAGGACGQALAPARKLLRLAIVGASGFAVLHRLRACLACVRYLAMPLSLPPFSLAQGQRPPGRCTCCYSSYPCPGSRSATCAHGGASLPAVVVV